ncbi:hypothetical protein [Amycolatopsis mediterranei]|uniref:hypothetical protein n=1 Tax=Amycolatopsis mediterranei TaxID=33910 RepID=UPI00049ED131|nr:hypothetical protein [Amycolatopsis mediterranei]KDO07347.1 hypothetical protein DV26_29105 [Amycolatopsis mediterranei]KDU91886.1 hypothetical protein DV36_12945 [Amycolatopsis mediterranei]UZF69997.1 hypothetical protein ISP_003182 [Amycolatopsis mediterranei]
MAGFPWTCAQCGAVNDPVARRCGTCKGLAPGRARARALWVLLTLMVVAGVAVGGVLLFTGDSQPPSSASGPFPEYTTPALPTTETVITTANGVTPPVTPSTTTSTSADKPCPGDAARYLPGGTGTALLVAQTAKSLVTICRTPDGRIFYDGQARGQAASDDTHIMLPAQAEGGGFVAVNGDYRYQVDGGRLVVSAGSEVLSDEELTTVG